jgi:hypothetical protein
MGSIHLSRGQFREENFLVSGLFYALKQNEENLEVFVSIMPINNHLVRN